MSPRIIPRKIKFAANACLLILGLFLSYLVVKASGTTPAALLDKTKDVNYGGLLFVMAAYYLQSLFMAKRWAVLLGCYTDLKVLPKGFIFYNANIGLLLSSFIPVFGNMGAKALVGKLEHGISPPKTVYATSLEYLIGFTVVVAMLIPSSLYALHILSLPAGIIGLALILIGLLLGFPRYFRFLLHVFGIILAFGQRVLGNFSRLRNLSSPAGFFPESFRDIDHKTSARLVRLSLLVYAVILARCYIYVRAFNIPIDVFKFSLLFFIGYALSSLSLTPGNLGIAELGWFGVLTLVGVGRENAAFYALGKRIIDMGAVLILAAGGYGYYLYQKKRRIALPLAGQKEERLG